MRVQLPVFCALILIQGIALGGNIVPEDWLSAERLKQAEEPIQQQLDTGQNMGGTAWDMAAVKDARLLVIYITLFESLTDDASRKKLYSEQKAWLQRRKKMSAAAGNSDGGTMESLDRAMKYMELTDKRIAELQKRLKN